MVDKETSWHSPIGH